MSAFKKATKTLLVLAVGHEVEPIRAAVVALLWPVVPLLLVVIGATGGVP